MILDIVSSVYVYVFKNKKPHVVRVAQLNIENYFTVDSCRFHIADLSSH